jgi:hypothetical protein
LSLTTAKIQDICTFMANLQKWNCWSAAASSLHLIS